MTSAPILLRSVTVSVDQHRAFSVFTDEVAAWWPTQSHGIFGPACGRVAFENGLIIERATDGEQVVWGEVLAWEPPDRLCFTWHPAHGRRLLRGRGPLRGHRLCHPGRDRAPWMGTLRRGSQRPPSRLHRTRNVGRRSSTTPTWRNRRRRRRPTLPATAYEAFYLEVAERGGFGAPPDGEGRAAHHRACRPQRLRHDRRDSVDPARHSDHLRERHLSGSRRPRGAHREVCRRPQRPGGPRERLCSNASPSWGASAPTNALLRWPAGCITTEPPSWTPNARGRRSPSRCRRPGTCRRTPASSAALRPEPQTRYSARTNNTRARSRRSSRRRPSGANRIPYSACRAELIAVASLVSAASTHGSETPLLSEWRSTLDHPAW